MKHEWRKKEKQLYLPKNKPEHIIVPALRFFTIKGSGNPNNNTFPEYISVLYALSYAVKMSYKKGYHPENYYDYTVYPLEGVWDINDQAKASFNGQINKDDLIFKLMIRQPDFVDDKFAKTIIDRVKKDKPHFLLDHIKFEMIDEGDCIQMMHLGSYDSEPESFSQMEDFARQHGYMRKSKIHREIYLSDARKVPAEKLKTVLRFQVSI